MKTKTKPYLKKLTPEEVYLMRQLKVVGDWHKAEADKLTTKQIAEVFGVSITTAHDAITGNTWRDVPFPDAGKGKDQ
jgi:hypothetical protein